MATDFESKPIVSVIMGVNNGAKFLRQSIDSIVSQSFADWELIVVDDGSTDGTLGILNSYLDARVVVLVNSTRRGLAHSLNRAINHARSEFLARFDADDICLPNRLANQLHFMLSYPKIGVLGGSMVAFSEGSQNKPMRVRENSNVAKELLHRNVLMHPTVMIRSSLLSETGLRYDETLAVGQDYDLWCRLIPHTQIANHDEVVVKYRIHPLQQTIRNRNRQRKIALRVQWRLLTNRDSVSRFGMVSIISGYFSMLRNLGALSFNQIWDKSARERG